MLPAGESAFESPAPFSTARAARRSGKLWLRFPRMKRIPRCAGDHRRGRALQRSPNVPPGRYQLHADCKGYLHAWYGADTANHPAGNYHAACGRKTRRTWCCGWRRWARFRAWSPIRMEIRCRACRSACGCNRSGEASPGSSSVLQRLATTAASIAFRASFPAATSSWQTACGHQAFRMQPEAVAGEQPPAQARFGVQFYPGTDRMSAASVIAVEPGREVRGMDFRMSPNPTSTLRGTVIPPIELPADTRIDVAIVQQDLPDENQAKFAFSVPGPNYSFEQYGVVPGEYILVTHLSLGERQYRGVQRVEISGRRGQRGHAEARTRHRPCRESANRGRGRRAAAGVPGGVEPR